MEELEIIKQALNAAQAKGSYSLKDAHTIFEVVTSLEDKINRLEANKAAEKEPVTENTTKKK